MITIEQVEELQKTHGRVVHVKGEGWEAVFRKPKRVEYKRFRAMLFSDAKADAAEWLALATVVVPERAALDALLEDYPGIPEAASKALTQIAGITIDESAK